MVQVLLSLVLACAVVPPDPPLSAVIKGSWSYDWGQFTRGVVTFEDTTFHMIERGTNYAGPYWIDRDELVYAYANYGGWIIWRMKIYKVYSGRIELGFDPNGMRVILYRVSG